MHPRAVPYRFLSESCASARSPRFVPDASLLKDKRGFYSIAKHQLNDCRGFQVFPNRNHPLCALTGMKIVGLGFRVSDGQRQLLRIAQLFEHGSIELGVREACERDGRVVDL